MHAKDKSTNVRFMNAIRWLGRRHPDGVGRLATRLFFMPPRPRGYAWGDAALIRGAQRLPVQVRGHRLEAWRFGSGPQVLVQHGWGGRTLQLTPVIRALVRAGYSVLALDAPGHGASGWRPASSIVHFADAVDELLRLHGPALATIAHSLGGAAVAHSRARGSQTGPLILVAPFAKPERFYRGFLAHVGLDDDAVRAAAGQVEAELGVRFGALELVSSLAQGEVPTFIIHDRDDRRVAFRASQRVAEQVEGVYLHATHGLGHSRVLADEDVHRFIVEVLASLPLPPPSSQSATKEVRSHMVPSMGELMADLDYGRA